MGNVLGQSLSEKRVMTSDGSEVGNLHNVTIDLDTGKLRNLLVTPKNSAQKKRFKDKYDMDERGRFLIPAGKVEAVKDYILISD